MIFDINPIWGLIPLILYVILSFNEKLHPIFNVVVCVILSAILTKQDFSSFGGIISASLGSFLGMIGFIIMIGSGLGA
ncbi:MAG: citrate transporter, partial [Anaerotignum sp.]|nr:citrate transporter [Anaerotignum sp.]